MSNYDRRDRQDETAMWDAGEVRRQESAQQQRRGDEKRRSARRRTGTAIYLVCVVLGSVLDAPLVWNLSDLFNALMVFPNLIALLALSGLVAKVSREDHELRK